MPGCVGESASLYCRCGCEATREAPGSGTAQRADLQQKCGVSGVCPRPSVLEGRASVGASIIYRRFVAWVCRNPRLATLWLAVACVPALALTIHFFGHVEAGLQELLPRNTPAVSALERIHARLGSQSHLTI